MYIGRLTLLLLLFGLLPMHISCDTVINPSLKLINFDRNTINFYGVKIGEERIETFKIKNIGTRDININKIELTSFSAGTTAGELHIVDYTEGEDIIIAGSKEQSVRIKIKCLSGGTKSAKLKVYHNASNTYSPFIINVSAICNEAEIEIMPTSCDFGSLLIYNRTFKYFSIKNTGQSDFVVLAMSIIGNTSSFKIITLITLPVQIKPDETIMIAIEFYSLGAEGTKEAFFEVIHNASNKASPYRINLTGRTVLEQPLIEITPNLYDFGYVSVNDNGTIDQEQVNSSADVQSWWSVWQSFKPLKSGEIRKIDVYLSNPLNQSRTFELRSDVGSSGQLMVKKEVTILTNYSWVSISIPQSIFLTAESSYTWIIYGLGLTSARTHLVNPYSRGRSYHDSEADLMFRTYMLENSTQVFTIRNIGNKDLVINKFEITGTDNQSFVFIGGQNAPYIVKPSLTHTVEVRFLPTAPVGKKSANLKIEHNASGSPHYIYITGNAY